jgi:glycosyltransferase involved in cell wall biosynthesis
MRILIVTPEFPPHSGGGISKYYALFADALAACGASVAVLVATPFSAFDDYVTAGGVDVRFVPLAAVEQHGARLSHLSAAPNLRRWIAAGLAAADVVRSAGSRFDVVETTDFGLLFAPLVALEERPPIVVKMHGSIGQISEHEPVAPAAALDASLARLIEATLLPSADALHAYSPMNGAEWAARLRTHVDVVPPPMRPSTPRLETDATEYTGLVAARIQAWKGPAQLCEAIRVAGSSLPADSKIAWAGRDSETAPGGGSLSAWLTREYPGIWGTRVVPIGLQPPDRIAHLQAAVRCVIVPSLWDTFNFTLAESMAAGCVTVGSLAAGASWLLDDGVNGFTADVSNAIQFAGQLQRVSGLNDSTRAALGAAARATIERELDPAIVACRSIELMKGIHRSTAAPQTAAWIREFLDPHTDPAANASFLENVSIRQLAAHLGQRLVRKISN